MLGKAMTTRGRQSAALFGVMIALLLPKDVPCGVPGKSCEIMRDHVLCTPTETEPLGVYALEWIVRRDLGLAYSRQLDCP